MKLAEHYADEVIKQTRRERAKTFPKTATPRPRRKGKSRTEGKIDF